MGDVLVQQFLKHPMTRAIYKQPTKEHPNMTFQYFAYGSNMLTERIRARCPSAKPIGNATAIDFDLEFSKRSKDCSGKATLKSSPGRIVHGVLFTINRCHLWELDKAEGAGSGYSRYDVFPVRPLNRATLVDTTCYLATDPENGLIPYDWYLALVIAGARQHRLDREYMDCLSRFDYMEDLCSGRRTRKHALKALRASGFPDYKALLPCHT